ncbi:MAG TPA: helix-hairpin-helix domain-containing protein [Dongiaceae bacterium]|nr:helix-hairpin-helix domain-containing protein [Dongiaceae bacterium]
MRRQSEAATALSAARDVRKRQSLPEPKRCRASLATALQTLGGKSTAAEGAQAFVLIMVLVVVLLASMVVTSLMFVLTAEQMASATGKNGQQARAAALSGVYRALRAAAEAETGSTDWQDNPAVFRDQLVCDDGVQKWYFSVYSLSESGGLHYGLTDEASKINVYRATEAMLEALPNLTPALAQGLLAARGGAAPAPVSPANPGTAPVSAPVSAPVPAPVPPPVSSPVPSSSSSPASGAGNAQWTCLDELLQVSGFTIPLLYGSYSNLTGSAEVQADGFGFGTAAVADTQESGPDTGLQQFLTVCSYDLNLDNEGRARVNLNQDDLSGLGLSKGMVDYVLALRKGNPLAELEDLLAAPALKDAQGKEVQLLAEQVKADLPILLDRCTTTNQAKLIGLVNLNTASTKVLAALPGLNPPLAEAIVAARVGLSPEARTTAAWLFQDGLLNQEAFSQAARYLTTRSYQFRFRVAAYSIPAGNYCVFEAVVDAAAKPPAVLLLRDVSILGLPFTPAPPENDSSPQVASVPR